NQSRAVVVQALNYTSWEAGAETRAKPLPQRITSPGFNCEVAASSDPE
ncbi:hypothetical protein LEMLEM_LOCUS3244, partial [Lemmus lemmus]